MPAIILVQPQLGENIGAAARVMANFAADDLRLVAPRDGWPNPKAVEMAAHAAPLLETAKIYPDLAGAVADLQFVYALTAREREMDKRSITPREMNVTTGTGFVFGPERTGLSNEDLSLCDEIIFIPVNPQYKSINLAQSVAIICYELAHFPIAQKNRELASKEELQGLFQHLEEELSASDFFQEPVKKAGMMINIRNMLTRAQFSVQELRTMRGMIRSLSQPRKK